MLIVKPYNVNNYTYNKYCCILLVFIIIVLYIDSSNTSTKI